MSQSAPSFPAFDEWEKMSESEQDELLDKLEGARHRSWRTRRVLIAALCLAACAAAGAVLLGMGF